MLNESIFRDALVNTTPTEIEICGKIITPETIREKGLILDYMGTPGSQALKLTSRIVAWSPNKMTTTMVGNQVVSLVRFDNRDESVVKATATACVELDGEIYLGSALFVCPRLSPMDIIWQDDVLGIISKWGVQLQLIAEFFPSMRGDSLDLFTRANSPENYLRLEVNSFVLWIPNKEHEIDLKTLYGGSRKLVKGAPIGTIQYRSVKPSTEVNAKPKPETNGKVSTSLANTLQL